MSHSTQHRSFRTRSSQPTSWLVLKKLNVTQQQQTIIRKTKILQHKINKKLRSRTTSGLEREQGLFYSSWGPYFLRYGDKVKPIIGFWAGKNAT